MNRKRLVTTAALAGLMLALACAGASPSATVRAFYEAIAKGKTDEAIGLLSEQTVSMIGKEKLRAGLQEAARKMLAKGGLKGVEIVDEKIAGEVADVTALIKYGDGSQEREALQLIKEKYGWRLKPKK